MDKIVFGYSVGSQYKTIALSELGARSMQLSYNVDSPDTLQIVLSPENYEKLLILPGGKINVIYSGEKIFAGTLAAGAQYDYDAGSAPSVTLEFLSDYHLLDSIAYAALDSNGEAVFSRRPVKTPTTKLSELVASIASWVGTKMPSTLSCAHTDTVPTPQSNGTASCASLLSEAMRWVPDIMLVQRYDSLGDNLKLVKTTDNRAFFLTKDSKLQSLSVQARNDLKVPVCALVGGARGVWPATGDIRTPGAFVYAVPVAQNSGNQKDAPQRGAGESPASAKMIVRGVKLPDTKTFERGKTEYAFDPVSGNTTPKFIRRFFPELAPLEQIGWVGACFVNVKTASEFKEELDDDDASVPKNYDDSVESWGHNVYVHTEGAFPASSDSRKNVKGLRWCKAQLSIVFAVKSKEKHSELQKKLISETLPGKQSIKGVPYYFVKKTLTCTLINRRKKVYDPATGSLCSSDPNYAEDNQPDDSTNGEQDENLTATDYKAAMSAYYASANKLQYEGSATVLFSQDITPWDMTGRRLNVYGWLKEWESMGAVIRSVSWDVGSRKVGISFGPRSVMGFDEILERRTIARNTSLNTAHETAITYDPADAPAKEEAEEAMSVSPSISASNDTNSIGRYVKPLTLYLSLDNETVMLAGGTFYKNGQKITVPDTDKQIKEGEPSGAGWQMGMAVKSKIYTKSDGTLTYDIYQ